MSSVYNRMISSAQTSLTNPLFQSFFDFLIAVLTSTTLSALLYLFIDQFSYSRIHLIWNPLESWQDIIILVCWKVTELTWEWFGGCDSYDVVSLTLLSHGPLIYLLVSFYDFSPSTVLPNLMIDSIVAYFSFRLVRPLSLAHIISSKQTQPLIVNHEILKSTTIQVYMVILSASIYAITIFTAYKTCLLEILLTYFNKIPNITLAESQFYITQFPTTICLGLAAKSFLFTPVIATKNVEEMRFDAKTASFWETLWYNIWGYSTRSKMVIKRTILLMMVTSLNTLIQICVAIEGVEFLGAVAYTAMWLAASGITGMVFGFVAAA